MFKENIDSAGAMVRSFARVAEQVTYCLEVLSQILFYQDLILE